MKKVLFLFGGRSHEHIVSCNSLKSIIENIDESKFSYTLVGIDNKGDWYLYNDSLDFLKDGSWIYKNKYKIDNISEYLKQFDVIFPIIHGNFGEDGRLQGLFESLKIPFVGSKTLSSAICMDKLIFKSLMEKNNIPVVPYLAFSDKINKKAKKSLYYPIIVKPSREGSSIGIKKVKNKNELDNAIKYAKKFDKKIIIEKFINAKEIEIAILENNHKLIISTPGEIISANDYYDFDAKYNNSESKTLIPANIPNNIIAKMKDYAKLAYKFCECTGFARVDFFYEESSGKIYINEINTIPGFTKISMFPKLLEYEKINYQKQITILINNALKDSNL